MISLAVLAAAGCDGWPGSSRPQAVGAAVAGDSLRDSTGASKFVVSNPSTGRSIGGVPPIFDGGVVLVGVPTNLCVPIDRFGWDAPERIERIETSCHCAAARLVRYWTRNPRRTVSASNDETAIRAEAATEITEATEASESNSTYGVLVSFSEEPESDSTFHPTPLLIELTAHYTDGQSHSGRLKIFVSREETW